MVKIEIEIQDKSAKLLAIALLIGLFAFTVASQTGSSYLNMNNNPIINLEMPEEPGSFDVPNVGWVEDELAEAGGGSETQRVGRSGDDSVQATVGHPD